MPNFIDLFPQNYSANNNPLNTMSMDPTQYLTGDPFSNLISFFETGLTNTLSLLNSSLGLSLPTSPTSLLEDILSLLSLFGIGPAGIGEIATTLDDIPFFGPLIEVITDTLGGSGNTSADLQTALSQFPLIGPLVAAITGQGGSNPLGSVQTDLQSGLNTIESWFSGLTGLLGNPSLGGVTSPTAAGTAASGQTLQSLLNLVGTDTVITHAQLAAVAPGAGSNVLPATVNWSMINGSGLWAFDGPGRSGGDSGCIRTLRTGVITVFYCHGLDNLAPPLITGPGPTDPMTTTYQIANAYGLDFTHFQFVNIPHAGVGIPMGPDHAEGLSNFISAIQNIPGKFCIYAGSEGAWMASDIYDLLRYGQYYDHESGAMITNTTLMSRNDDFLLGVVWGNMRRQAGTTFPGAPVFGKTGYGCLDPPLANVEPDRWWEFAVDAGTYPAGGSMTGITYEFADVIGNCPPASDSAGGQIRAIVSQATQETSLTLGEILSVGGDLLESYIAPTGGAAQLWWNLATATSAHATEWTTVQPFLATGDTRTYANIIFDAINNLSPLASPPEGGVRHQQEGVRQVVKPFQVVTASCYVEWINIFVPDGYTSIILGVNAYDANGVYIPGPPGQPVSVIYPTATITAPISQSSWQLMQADFVMPPNTATACIVFDVEPLAMTTGDVWFDVEGATFEVSSLLDGALIDSSTIQQLLATQVGGIQGEADLLTSIQNMLDGLASANSNVVVTGASIASMFASAAQTANSAAEALSLSVSSANTLGSLANPIYTGFRQGAQVTTQFVSTTTTVAAGSSIVGIIGVSPAISIGLIEFLANGTPTSNVFLNVYSVDPITGNFTNLWSSVDIYASIPSSFGWVDVTIPSANIVTAPIGQLLAIELANGSAVSITVAAATTGLPNHPSIVPQNQGVSRTLASTGGVTPATITSGLTYSGVVPCISVSASAGTPAVQPTSSQNFPAAGTYTYDLPSWIADGDQVAIAMIPGGGGGTSGQYFGYGWGGSAGTWQAATLTYGSDIPGSTTSFTVTVGAGGVSGGGTGGASSVSGAGFSTITTGSGGAGGSSGSTVGLSPGNESYGNTVYFGGIASGGAANAPGGGGGAGNAGFFGLGGTPAYAGADGEVWITVKQGAAISSETISYSTPGSYTYNIPTWANYLDFIILSGGGSGATWDNINNDPGGAGEAGMWSVSTIDKSGFPSGAVTVTVGAAGAQAVASPEITWQGTNTNCFASSIAIPTHQPGDMIEIIAVDASGAGVPAVPTAAGTVPAWQYLGAGTIGSMSLYAAYVIATASNHTSGTWGNADMMAVSVMRGVDPTRPLGAGTGTGGFGTPASPALSLVDNSGNSYLFNLYIVNNGGSGLYVGTWDAAPAGFTRLGAASTAVGMLCSNAANDTTTAGGAYQSYSPALNLAFIGLQGEMLCNYNPPYNPVNGNTGTASSVSGTGMTTVTAAGGAGGVLDGAPTKTTSGGKSYNNVLYVGSNMTTGDGGVGGTSVDAYTGHSGGDGEVWIVARS